MNVLKGILIPRITLTIKYILSELEELEREEVFRLKRVKEKNMKKPLMRKDGAGEQLEAQEDSIEVKVDLEAKDKETTKPVEVTKSIESYASYFDVKLESLDTKEAMRHKEAAEMGDLIVILKPDDKMEIGDVFISPHGFKTMATITEVEELIEETQKVLTQDIVPGIKQTQADEMKKVGDKEVNSGDEKGNKRQELIEEKLAISKIKLQEDVNEYYNYNLETGEWFESKSQIRNAEKWERVSVFNKFDEYEDIIKERDVNKDDDDISSEKILHTAKSIIHIEERAKISMKDVNIEKYETQANEDFFPLLGAEFDMTQHGQTIIVLSNKPFKNSQTSADTLPQLDKSSQVSLSMEYTSEPESSLIDLESIDFSIDSKGKVVISKHSTAKTSPVLSSHQPQKANFVKDILDNTDEEITFNTNGKIILEKKKNELKETDETQNLIEIDNNSEKLEIKIIESIEKLHENTVSTDAHSELNDKMMTTFSNSEDVKTINGSKSITNGEIVLDKKQNKLEEVDETQNPIEIENNSEKLEMKIIESIEKLHANIVSTDAHNELNDKMMETFSNSEDEITINGSKIVEHNDTESHQTQPTENTLPPSNSELNATQLAGTTVPLAIEPLQITQPTIDTLPQLDISSQASISMQEHSLVDLESIDFSIDSRGKVVLSENRTAKISPVLSSHQTQKVIFNRKKGNLANSKTGETDKNNKKSRNILEKKQLDIRKNNKDLQNVSKLNTLYGTKRTMSQKSVNPKSFIITLTNKLKEHLVDPTNNVTCKCIEPHAHTEKLVTAEIIRDNSNTDMKKAKNIPEEKRSRISKEDMAQNNFKKTSVEESTDTEIAKLNEVNDSTSCARDDSLNTDIMPKSITKDIQSRICEEEAVHNIFRNTLVEESTDKQIGKLNDVNDSTNSAKLQIDKIKKKLVDLLKLDLNMTCECKEPHARTLKSVTEGVIRDDNSNSDDKTKSITEEKRSKMCKEDAVQNIFKNTLVEDSSDTKNIKLNNVRDSAYSDKSADLKRSMSEESVISTKADLSVKCECEESHTQTEKSVTDSNKYEIPDISRPEEVITCRENNSNADMSRSKSEDELSRNSEEDEAVKNVLKLSTFVESENAEVKKNIKENDTTVPVNTSEKSKKRSTDNSETESFHSARSNISRKRSNKGRETEFGFQEVDLGSTKPASELKEPGEENEIKSVRIDKEEVGLRQNRMNKDQKNETKDQGQNEALKINDSTENVAERNLTSSIANRTDYTTNKNIDDNNKMNSEIDQQNNSRNVRNNSRRGSLLKEGQQNERKDGRNKHNNSENDDNESENEQNGSESDKRDDKTDNKSDSDTSSSEEVIYIPRRARRRCLHPKQD